MRFIVVHFFMLIVYMAHGQTGFLRGEIFSSDNALLESAEIMITSADSLSFTTRSNNDGKFEFKDIPSSTYVMEVSRNGYVSERTSGVPVSPGRITFIDFRLNLIDKPKRRKKIRERKKKKIPTRKSHR